MPIHPKGTFIGDLPPQCTALISTNFNVQELTMAALLNDDISGPKTETHL